MMDHLLSRATRMRAPRTYILVGCLANNTCANHCGKNHFATMCSGFQPYQLVRRSTQMPCDFIDTALCAWNTLPYYLVLLALSCSSRLYTFLLPESSSSFPPCPPQSSVRCSTFPDLPSRTPHASVIHT